MEIYVQEAWAIQFMPRLPQKTKDKISKGIAIFDWILAQCLEWRQAAIPDAAWPALAFEAAKALACVRGHESLGNGQSWKRRLERAVQHGETSA